MKHAFAIDVLATDSFGCEPGQIGAREESIQRCPLRQFPAYLIFRQFSHEFGHALALSRRFHAHAAIEIVGQCDRDVFHRLLHAR
jgi:hypothetical protein